VLSPRRIPLAHPILLRQPCISQPAPTMASSSVEVARAPLVDQGPAGDEPRPRHDDEDAEVEQAIDETDDAQPRKKRRVIQSSDKKYICPAQGCGKRYSRNEHLYRHQLNRTSLNFLESRCFDDYGKEATSKEPTLTNMY
jgi:hypothetical protein